MKKFTVVELNVPVGHMNLVVRAPPGLSALEITEFVKERTSIRLFAKLPYLRKRNRWGN